MDFSTVGIEHAAPQWGRDATDTRAPAPVLADAAGAGSIGTVTQQSDRIEISPLGRSMAHTDTAALNAAREANQDLQIDFLQPIMRSVLLRLSERFYQVPGIQEQLAQRIDAAMQLE